MQPDIILKEHLLKTVSLTDQEFDHVFKHFKPLSLKKGQQLITVDDKVDSEYFVLSGCLKTFCLKDEHKMFILQFAMPTWWASDYEAMYYETPATMNIDCVTDSQVLELKSRDREKLCDEIRGIGHFFRLRTNKGYVGLQKRLLSFMNNDAKGRYEELLKLYPDLYNTVPKNLIAAYLGVSRETLSRF